MNSPDTPRQPDADDRDESAEASVISALVDGRADALDRACSRWRDDAQARDAWHAYHLIGDVMRSDELARPAAADAAFVAALRDRLAAEPVPLAPRRRQPWLLPLAAAAGFAVAGVLVVPRLVGSPAGDDGAPKLAAAAVPAPAIAPAIVAVGNPGPADADASAADAPAAGGAGPAPALIRDPRLDEYLRAHRAAWGGIAVAAPGGMLRRVDDERAAGVSR